MNRKTVLIWAMILILIIISACSKSKDGYVEKQNNLKLTSSWGTMSKIDNSDVGYYIATTRNQVLFYDIATKQTVPLCNKPDCEHDVMSKECNAYIPFLVTGGCQYYNGSVYVVSIDTDGKVELYNLAKDGSHNEKVLTLYETSSNPKGAPGVFKVYGEYAYFLVWNMQENEFVSQNLYRKKLDGTEREELVYANLSDKLGASYIELVPSYEGKMYFIDTYYFEDNLEKVYGSLYCYDPETGKNEEILSDVFGDFFILEDEVYYQNNGEPIRKYNLGTKEVTEFSPLKEGNTWLWISSDGKYVYSDNFFDCENNFDTEYENRCITVYNLDGTIKDRISLKGVWGHVFFGDEKNMIYEQEGKTWIYDKGQIGTEKQEWVEMKINNIESFG